MTRCSGRVFLWSQGDGWEGRGHRGAGGIQETQKSWHHGEGRLSGQRWRKMGELKRNLGGFTADGDFKN